MILKKIQFSSAPSLAVAAVVSIAVIAVIADWYRPRTDSIVQTALQAVRGESLWFKADTGYVNAASAAPAIFTSGTENLPRSLQDTQVPEGLAQDAAGNLIISQGLRDVFEYFLSAMVDEEPATIHARLVAYIRSHVGSQAAQHALAILDQYGAYKQALPGLAKHYMGERPDQIKARLAAIQNLRRASLGSGVAQAFFGEDEAWVAYTIKSGEILEDKQLSSQQKTARIAELKNTLSTHLQESMASSEMLHSLDAVQAEWTARGGTPEELRASRETIVGRDGAVRLEALDRANADWEARISTHLAQRTNILADASIAPERKAQHIEALRTQNFTSDERARALALEGLHDEMASSSAATVH